jgi:hypothetical protein
MQPFASINSSGNVTGIAAGSATITYTVTTAGCTKRVYYFPYDEVNPRLQMPVPYQVLLPFVLVLLLLLTDAVSGRVMDNK